MDRKAWIAIILSVIGLFAWQWYFTKAYGGRNAHPAASATPAASAAPASKPGASSAAAATPASTPRPTVMEARSESLYTKSAEYIFSNDTGGIARVLLYGHLGENHEAVSLNNNASSPIGAIGNAPNEPLGGFAMKTDAAAGRATFTRHDSDGLQITKTFSVPQIIDKKTCAYAVTMDLEFKNTGTMALSRPAFYVSTGGAAPIHSRDLPTYTKFDWKHGGSYQSIDVNWFAGGSFLGLFQTRAPQTLYQESKPDVLWAGVASQYFCTIVSTDATKGASVWASRFDSRRTDNVHVFGIEGGLGMPAFTIEPGQSQSEKFTIYAGPKELSQLRRLPVGQDAVMNFGMFGIISEILLWGMNSLYGIFHNYAAAIIVLTLIIKSLLWFPQNKATTEMRRMALLSPIMTEMKEKYKDDPQKMNEEMMKLYREYGVNPLSGCLPMLIQIPIFFGFYTMLGSAIELRNASFLWVHDLSQPDTLTHIAGFPINVLPLVMACTMVWQMVISPKSGDATQQRIFYFMPIIFLVFCYNYASALALYWTTQNLFSIVQLYLTRNKPLPTLEKKSAIAKREAAAAKKKKRRPGQ